MQRISSLARLALMALLLLPLSACAEPKATVSVSAINYTGETLNSFVFSYPDDPTRAAGGPGLHPYEAGGTMCCYSLPKKWRPGIKVKLIYDWWNGSGANRDRKTRIFEIPRYPDREPGMLWAIFYEDGSVEVVASDYDPGHPKWPGKINHWPVPSVEYKRKLWAEEVERTRDTIQNSRDLLAWPEASEETKKSAQGNLEYYSKYLEQLLGKKP